MLPATRNLELIKGSSWLIEWHKQATKENSFVISTQKIGTILPLLRHNGLFPSKHTSLGALLSVHQLETTIVYLLVIHYYLFCGNFPPFACVPLIFLYFLFPPISFSPPPLLGNQQASPCMSLVLLKVFSCYIKWSFSLQLLPAEGSVVNLGLKIELNRSFHFCTTLSSVTSVCLSLCSGLQTRLLFRTDPLPAFNEAFFPTWI